MYTVYILKSLNFQKTYVGMTNDFERRFLEHNGGKNTFTKKFTPWETVYIEKCVDRKEARKREKYFKSGAGRKRISAIIK